MQLLVDVQALQLPLTVLTFISQYIVPNTLSSAGDLSNDGGDRRNEREKPAYEYALGLLLASKLFAAIGRLERAGGGVPST